MQKKLTPKQKQKLQQATEAVENLKAAIAELEADGAFAAEIKPYRDNLAAAELKLAKAKRESN